MELKQAIEILKEMQKWRRGEGIYDGELPAPMPHTPEKFGIAIDKLIEYAEGRELTWQDIQVIVDIADEVIATGEIENNSQEAYYTEVLKRFKEESK